VPTAFACRALLEAYQAFRDTRFVTVADEVCRFILSGLTRPVDSGDEICFSYTPIDESVVYNATLLAGESLASAGQITGNDEYIQMAARSARFVINRQRTDGAWVYGEAAAQQWVDNFHTAYILMSLDRISNAVPGLRPEISGSLSRGIEYWIANFFADDGAPKYYDNSLYPIDIHSAAVAVVGLSNLRHLDERLLPLARRTIEWTVENMLDADGHFYYQRKRNVTIKTPFMRWGQAWMAYALARLLEAEAAD
jgi:hypothetical protein